VLPNRAYCQDEKKTISNGSDGTLTVPEIDSTTGKAKNLEENEKNTSISTVKVGLGYIGDYAAFSQDATFKRQMDSANLDMKNAYATRDFRILASGLFKTKREISWKFAFMYNGDTKEWLVRESGVIIGVPELAGRFFIGRMKEGYSLIKVQNGHSVWGVERTMAIDVVPILGDGIKYFGYLPKSTVFWNLGYYNDFISKDQSFSTFSEQYVARVGFLPYYDKQKNTVLHVAVNYLHAKPEDGKFNMKSRPESNIAPQIINTGSFATDNADIFGGEAYYSTGHFLVGSEVALSKFYTPTGNHQFFGGNAVISYLFNGMRPYKTDGSIFGFVDTKTENSITKGGWGTWEALVMLAQFDLNDGNIQGGKLWRITPMVNWYMTKRLRLEFIYGYAVLDRYNLEGTLQIFQTRVQFTLL
jgi:phosphate-selective porin OprO/OprP